MDQKERYSHDVVLEEEKEKEKDPAERIAKKTGSQSSVPDFFQISTSATLSSIRVKLDQVFFLARCQISPAYTNSASLAHVLNASRRNELQLDATLVCNKANISGKQASPGHSRGLGLHWHAWLAITTSYRLARHAAREKQVLEW